MEILKDDHPFLRTKAKPISKLTLRDADIIEEMFKAMYDNNGIGLAATQIGWDAKVFITDVTGSDPKIFINPWITHYGKKKIVEKESCLSFPDKIIKVKRSEKITVKFQDLIGKEQVLQTKGLLARCILHEYDHLEGKLLIDYEQTE